MLKPPSSFSLNLLANDLIEQAKVQVASHLKVSVDQVKLVCNGKGLADGRTLQDYSLNESTTVHVMIKNPQKIEQLSAQVDEPSQFESAAMNPEFWQEITSCIAKFITDKQEIRFVIFMQDLNLIYRSRNQLKMPCVLE